MQDHTLVTGPDRLSQNNFRTTARAVGVVFLAGMAVYIVGNAVIVEPLLAAPDRLSVVAASSLPLAIGAMLMLMAAVGDALHGILMLPVLRRHNERIAFGYFAARIIDAVLIALGILFLLLQIPLSRAYLAAGADAVSSLAALSGLAIDARLIAYELAMTTVGFAGLMLCSVFYRARLVPRLLAIWGLIGYATLLAGSVLTLLGFELHLIHTIPGGLWELFGLPPTAPDASGPPRARRSRSRTRAAARRSRPSRGAGTCRRPSRARRRPARSSRGRSR